MNCNMGPLTWMVRDWLYLNTNCCCNSCLCFNLNCSARFYGSKLWHNPKAAELLKKQLFSRCVLLKKIKIKNKKVNICLQTCFSLQTSTRRLCGFHRPLLHSPYSPVWMLMSFAWMSRWTWWTPWDNVVRWRQPVWPQCSVCVCVLRNSLTWITWAAVRAPLVLTGRASLSFSFANAQTYVSHRRRHTLSKVPHRHVTSAFTHFHQSDDVIKALMRDYSDITGNIAKLNLLASPCAFSCVRVRVCVSVRVWNTRAYWGYCAVHQCMHSVIIHTVISPCMCTSEASVSPCGCAQTMMFSRQ